ncbi:acyl-CoA dehydratase activase-related protein [Halanaerobaculum tunisiense]
MEPKIGIPQALLYHNYGPAWEKFFAELDCKVVKSNKSTKKIVDAGVKLANDEACLPVKLFLGHVEYLKERSDYIFIPRVVSVDSQEYLCPKFMGLPDMVRYSVEELPPLLHPTVNLRRSKLNLVKPVLKLGTRLNKSYWQVLKATWQGWQALRDHYQQLRAKSQQADYKIAILGHEYIIHDSHISMGLVDQLEEMGLNVVTADMLPDSAIEEGLSYLSKDMFWSLSKRMLGAAYHFFFREDIDGIIQLTAFGCGPDSLVGEMIEREAKDKSEQPFMFLNLDEHTGEAGLRTRLEAFVDMIQWEGA